VWLDVTTLLEQGPRPGKALQITNEAKDSLACEKTKEHGCPRELSTTRVLARPIRQHDEAVGHRSMARIGRAAFARSSAVMR